MHVDGDIGHFYGVVLSRSGGQLLVEPAAALRNKCSGAQQLLVPDLIRRSRVLSDLQDEVDGDFRLPVQRECFLTWLQYVGTGQGEGLDHQPQTLVTVLQVCRHPVWCCKHNRIGFSLLNLVFGNRVAAVCIFVAARLLCL